MVQGFFFCGGIMANIIDAQNAFSKLLDIEYEFILGRKGKSVVLRVEFQKLHFFHLAGLQYLRDLPRLAIPAEEVYNQLEEALSESDLNMTAYQEKKINEKLKELGGTICQY